MKSFWNKVEITNSCWIWKGFCLKRGGYGRFTYKMKSYYAHRFVWFLIYGSFSKLYICHKCDNPPCVNPSHLFEGTAQDNVNDSVNKGRRKRRILKRQLKLDFPISNSFGGRSNHKLTFEEAQEIRYKYKIGKHSQRELSELYKIGHSTIQKIISMERYINPHPNKK